MSENLRSVSVSLNEMDLKKLDILKSRFGYKKNIEMIRYLMTDAIEKIISEPMFQKENEDLIEEADAAINGPNERCTNPMHHHPPPQEEKVPPIISASPYA